MDKQKIITGVLVAGGSFLAYKIGKKLWNEYLKSQAQTSLDEKPAVRWAMLLRSAINPSGVSWLKQTDGTSEQDIFSIAKEITKLDEVVSAYKDLYQDNLLDDLQRELDSVKAEREESENQVRLEIHTMKEDNQRMREEIEQMRVQKQVEEEV